MSNKKASELSITDESNKTISGLSIRPDYPESFTIDFDSKNRTTKVSFPNEQIHDMAEILVHVLKVNGMQNIKIERTDKTQDGTPKQTIEY
jgi:hypothetical protein